MSLQITRAGLLDTIQDLGRWGFQYLGVNPGGVMDRFSARLANALLGNDLNAPVLEIHFPGPQLLFEQPALICITGADFTPVINGTEVPVSHPIAVNAGMQLSFQRAKEGARAYLSFGAAPGLEPWMNSYSTHLKAGVGGFDGRALRAGDRLTFRSMDPLSFLSEKPFVVLPWSTPEKVEMRNELQFLMGSEWNLLTKEAQNDFQSGWFQITTFADRMGYKLAGNKLDWSSPEELISSAVTFGTVQLLPGGQLIILGADHQTAGGYPRIAHIISAHLPILAQKRPNDVLQFRLTDLQTAEAKKIKQQNFLSEIQIACKFRLQEYLQRV